MCRRKNNKNILCLESNWDGYVVEPKSGMKSLLDFVTINKGISYSYNFVNTIEELKYILCTINSSKFNMLYMGFHGKPNTIVLGSNKEFEIRLEELAEIMGYRFNGYGIHFASCAVLNVYDNVLEQFKKNTGAAFVSGYSTYVDFDESSLMDLALLNRWYYFKSYGKMFKGMEKSYKSLIAENSFAYYI